MATLPAISSEKFFLIDPLSDKDLCLRTNTNKPKKVPTRLI